MIKHTGRWRGPESAGSTTSKQRNQQGRRGQKITSSRVRTLPKNLICPLPVQDLEGKGLRRPDLLIAVGMKRTEGGSAVKRGESENWDDLDARYQAPFIGPSPLTDSYLRSYPPVKISRSV
jgi:hypothetical protein